MTNKELNEWINEFIDRVEATEDTHKNNVKYLKELIQKKRNYEHHEFAMTLVMNKKSDKVVIKRLSKYLISKGWSDGMQLKRFKDDPELEKYVDEIYAFRHNEKIKSL